MPSPDPSTQIAPDPAPSGGEFGSNGAGGQAPQQQSSARTSQPVTASHQPVVASRPASPVSTKAAPPAAAAHGKAHHRHRQVHHARTAPSVHVEAARRVPAVFASSLQLALHVPNAVPSTAAGGSDDALLFGAIALLLFVFSGLTVVRTTAEVMGRERPA